MKKIIFILPSLNAGGAERVALNFLRQLNVCKYDITLVVLDKTTDLMHLVPKCIRVVDLETKSARRSFWQLLKVFRHFTPDVVFTTHSRISTILMLAKPFSPAFKHIARMQSTPSLEKKHLSYGAFRRWLYALGFLNADVVVAQSDAMKADAVGIFKLKPEKINVLPNPLDSKHINECLTGASSPFPSGQIIAVASGRLAYAKGYDVLLKALPAVVEKHPKLVLYILGKDNGEEVRLRKLVSELQLDQFVKFLGYQSNPYPYYRFCDLFILSSRWEGFPNVVLENIYMNTPIVATRCVPVVEELIVEGANGELCEVEDIGSLADAISDCLHLKRKSIRNSDYEGAKLETLLG